MLLLIFFFKQKTASEVRISDWSSDVCSSDLHRARIDEGPEGAGNADVEGADGKGRELRPEGADANDLGSDVHVASRHPGAPDATAHKVLGDQRQDRHENQKEEIFHRRSAAGAGEDRKAHTSELQPLMRISYAVFCLKKKKNTAPHSFKH